MKTYSVHIALILTVLFSQLYNSAITALYQLKYDYYATVLCENKDKPEMHCNGKCVLAKQLKLSDHSEKQTEPPTLLPTLPLFNHAAYVWEQPFPTTETHVKLDQYKSLDIRSPFLTDIDPPPKV